MNFNNINQALPLVLAFNAAPGAGKDTLTDHLFDQMLNPPGLVRINIKDRLIELTQKHYNISDARLKEINTHAMKDVPLDEFEGKSFRQCLIHVSEDLIKPVHGKDYFIKLTVAMMQDPSRTYVITDLGFDEELELLTSIYGQNLVVVQVDREGYDFSKDSRKLVDASKNNRIQLNNVMLYDYLTEGLLRLVKTIAIFKSFQRF